MTRWPEVDRSDRDRPEGEPGPDGYRILVCGSRTFASHIDSATGKAVNFTVGTKLGLHPESRAFAATLDGLLAHAERTGRTFEVVHGAARTGGDAVAEQWCQSRDVTPERHPADWDAHGKGAGFVRNAEMVKTLDSDNGLHMVLAAWDGISNGTKQTMTTAAKAGVPVIVVAAFDHRRHSKK